MIAPVVGFDQACYRLGYGGGFFDLTLAAMKNSPLKLGVGYRQQALLTIHPQPNDIPMDMVIGRSAFPGMSTFWKRQDWLGPRLNRYICVF